MPGHARKDIVRSGEIGVYHCWSRCVQRAHLCGEDPLTGQNFEHRRHWIKSLLEYQASVFAVDVGNYSILSNHQHLIARTRPDIAAAWTDEEVAWRWKLAWPRWSDGRWFREPTDEEIEELLAKPERIPVLRANLASLSWFLARWKEPISKMCNAESEKKGHFYEQRFGSREIVDDAANLCCNVYVDLNQLKAGMARTLEESTCSAIYDRLLSWQRSEAEESVERFEATSPSEGYVLRTSDVELLLADCFLAPIGDHGPSLLVGNNLSPPQAMVLVADGVTPDDQFHSSVTEPEFLTDVPQSLGADTAVIPNSRVLDPGAQPEEVDLTDGTAVNADGEIAAGQRPNRRKRPTRKIHRRLQRTRRRRASDHVFLGLPWEQYRDIVQWTAAQLGQQTSAQPPPEQENLLRKWGVEPSRWLAVVEHFGEMFHRAVGHADRLAEVVQRAGRKRLHGSCVCRDVFT